MNQDIKDIKILVVDDVAPTVALVSSILKAIGFSTIFSAQNGQEAFESFCEHNQDLIIADWSMTPINGLELTDLIRKSDRSPNQKAPIIMLTGHGLKDMVIKARDHGINEFIVKPFNADSLQSKISAIFDKPRDFVATSNFTGPDRRRRTDHNAATANKNRQSDKPTHHIVKKLQKELKTDKNSE